MCGIAGIITHSNNLVDQNQLKLISDIMQHRGPDAQGFYTNNNVGFAHNRLSLLDLSTNANQPFKNEHYSLVYNGEIYNWKAIRTELSELNIPFHTSSDTEVLFQALNHWGVEKTLTKINGMFAFAWYNIQENSVILARDRVGIKPLFYANINNQILFASEIKALCTDLGMFDLNMHYLAQAYYGVYETQRHISPFKQIKQLEPGHYLNINTQNLEITDHQWFALQDWADETAYRNREKKSQNEIRDEFAHLFKQSVDSMAVSDAPMGAFVSGGLDSSLVAATANESDHLQLFTANVVGKYSEFQSAQKLAQHLKSPLNEYHYLPEYFIRDIVDTTYHYDTPITLFTNSVAFSGVAKLAREKNVKAVLTGEGADEIFLGYPQLLTRRLDNLIQSPYKLINGIYKKIPGLSSYLRINAVDMQKEVIQQHLNGYKEKTADQEAMHAFSFLNEQKEDLRCQKITVNLIHRHLHSLLWRNDRMGMMHSIESRFPFLDEEIIKFALNLPGKFKIGKTNNLYNWKHPFMMDKAVARNYASTILPKELALKKKFGFGVHGHAKAELKVDINFFRNGFWQNACGMSNTSLELMYKECSPKLIAKLSSVEIWGSLFVNKENSELVKNRVESNFKMKI